MNISELLPLAGYLAKLAAPPLLAMAGSYMRAESENIRGWRKRRAMMLTSGFCGVIEIPLAQVLGINQEWLYVISGATGWVGGDVVLKSISTMALKKLEVRSDADDSPKS